MKSDKPCYMNKKGQIIIVQISGHAYQQFESRWKLLHPDKPLVGGLHQSLIHHFNRADRLRNLKGKDLLRLARHGKDTLFFRTSGFTFVVKDRTIVTVEISDRGMRHLNKGKLAQIGGSSE